MNSAHAVREFFDGVLWPANTEWRRAKSDKDIDRRFASMAFLEAYGWLKIGVQVGRFPLELANELLTSSVESLQQAAEMADKESLLESGVIQETFRLLNSNNHFPPPFSELFPAEFHHLPEAPTLFSLWSTESRAFAASLPGTRLAKTLTFVYEEDWEMVVAQLQNEQFVSDPSDTPDFSFFEGYLRALQHIHRIADLLTVTGVETRQWPARAIMRVKVAGVHSWRLSFGRGKFGPRFDVITAVIADRLAAEAATDGTMLRREGFIEAVAELKARYAAALGYLVLGAER